MEIISFSCQSSNFTSLTFELLKLPYHTFNDLDDLQNNIKDIKSEWLILNYKDFGLTEDFIYNLDEIKSLKCNTVLTSENILFDKNNDNKIINFKKNQNSFILKDKNIFTFLVNKKELVSLLEDKSITTFIKLSLAIKYDKICTFNSTTRIKFVNNMIDVSQKLFCNNFRNQKNIENIKNIKASYFQFIKSGKINKNYEEQIVKIYNEVNPYSMNILIVNTEEKLEELIEKYKNTDLNTKFNQIVILGNDKKIDNKKIKETLFSKIIYKNDIQDTIKYLTTQSKNYEIYFIDNNHKLENINNKKKIQVIFNSQTKNFDLFKISNYLLQFLKLNESSWNKFIEKMAQILLYYFKYELYIINEPISELPQIEKIKFVPQIDLIDRLYAEKNYDECCYLINFIIKNRFSYNYTFIYKTLVLVDKVNYIIHENEIKSLLTLLETDNFDDIFNVCVVLISNKFNSLAYHQFDKYISENEINENEILKVLLFCIWFNLFDFEINISKDTFLINHILKHFDFIMNNLSNIINIDKEVNFKELRVKLLIYLNNRFDLIKNETEQNKINNEIKKIALDFNNLDNTSNDVILNKFIEYPKLIINGAYILSDFMMSNEDIILKRKNLLRLTSIILDNFDKLEEKFLKMIKDGIDISLTNLFRYAYQGIPNKDLFHNCITITRKYKELNFKKIINKNNKFITEEQNLFIYNKKETNPKKICFISNFLGRKHSVFKDRHQVIKHLVKKGFDVYVATFNPLDFKYSQIFYGIKENIVLGNMNTFNIIQKLRSYKFDKLVFCEIGMDNRVTEIAHFRMANKQYNTWGHSDTSGYQEVDYFVSSELYELPYEESKNHYTEKLILQKGMCTSYVNPTSCYKLNLPRSYYGLSDFEQIICCPQSLFKIHPLFDEYIFEILKRNSNVSLVFLDNHDKKYKMYERWNRVLKNKPEYYGILSRVKFLPGQDHQKFCNLMKVSDILIDPYPFGGCNSSLESFSLGKPVVTQPSDRINGRFTYGFYTKMGFYDLVSNNKEEYVSIVTKLLQDENFRKQMSEKILKNKDILFQDKETLDEWEQLMSE